MDINNKNKLYQKLPWDNVGKCNSFLYNYWNFSSSIGIMLHSCEQKYVILHKYEILALFCKDLWWNNKLDLFLVKNHNL